MQCPCKAPIYKANFTEAERHDSLFNVCFNGLREILQTILIHVVKDASL